MDTTAHLYIRECITDSYTEMKQSKKVIKQLKQPRYPFEKKYRKYFMKMPLN